MIINYYLYSLSITAWVTDNNKYNFIKNMDGFYETLEEAVECGIDFMEQDVFYALANGNENEIPTIIKLFENDKNYGYNFEVTKICCDYLKFRDTREMLRFYHDNIQNVSKENLYEFLMRIAKIEHLKYSYSGRLIDSEFGDLNINTCSTRAFDEEKYHCDKFNIGDRVKRIEFGDDIYIITFIENKNNSIYDSNNPWNFVKGYILTPLGETEPINDYEAYRFMDEDLELVYKLNKF